MAIVAAIYMKDFLYQIHPNRVKAKKRISNIISGPFKAD